MYEPETNIHELPITTVDEETKKRRRRKICAVLLVVTVVAIVVTAVLASRYGGSSEASSGNYEEVMTASVPEVQADLVVYRHKRTHTQVISLVPTDTTQDKVFGISFRTIPSTSNGAAHVLEHSVLSGSAKYPSKDPFNALRRGSLQTFLNAMTYPDRTVYLVASRNHADFRNLMSVYLDAVFKPKVIRAEHMWILRQEGWRVEEKGDEELEFNGVVMSEMKGAYSDPSELMATYIQTALFPDTPYRFDSGGKPSVIPSLNHTELVDFYHKHYHPSNAQIFLYGTKMDIDAGLEQANEYLEQHRAKPHSRKESEVPWQKKNFDNPMRERRSYPVSEGDDSDYKVMITWLINDEEMDLRTEVAWYVLDFLLVGLPTSPLQEALTNSGLGDYVIDDGFDTDLQQYTYSIGLEGLEYEEDMDKVEEIVIGTLSRLVKDGFSQNEIAGAMNNVEFQIRELDKGDYPRGIGLLLDGLSKWNYDRDVLSGLQLQGALEELKGVVEESGSHTFVHLIRTGLLHNTHSVILELVPDTGLAQETQQEEEEQLDALRQKPEVLEQLIMEYDNMKEVQAKDDPPAVLATIPSLSVGDLDRYNDEYPIEVEQDAGGSGVTVLTHELSTSFGIAYVDFGLDMSAIDIDDIHLLPLLSRLMLENGIDHPHGDIHLQRQIAAHTGGIDLYPLIDVVRAEGLSDEHFEVLDGSNLSTKLFIRGKCTPENIGHLFSLFDLVLIKGTLDRKARAISVLKELISDLQYALSSEGDNAAKLRLSSRYGVVGYLFEELNGITSMQKLSEALNTAKLDWSSLLARLEHIKATILKGHRKSMVLNLTGEKKVLESIQSSVDDFLANQLPNRTNTTEFIDSSKVEHPWFDPVAQRMLDSSPLVDEAFVIPTQVSYVGKGGMLYQHGQKVNGSAVVVSNYLSRGYLYDELRLKRGAYGAQSRLDIRAGTLILTSYRDPNLASTLEVYDKAAAALKSEMAITRSSNPLPPEAEDAIIGTIGKLDGTAPQPGDIGWYSLRQWIRGESVELRQNWRNQILDTQWGDFGAFADRMAAWGQPSVATVTSQSEYEEAAAKGYTLKRITPLSGNHSSS